MEKLSVAPPQFPENLPNSSEVVTCPACGTTEYNKLIEGLCWECNEKKHTTERETAIRKKNAILVFGENCLKECTFENFKQVKGTEKAFEYCETFNPDQINLFIYGKTGRGKSHLCKAVAIRHFMAGDTVWFGLLSAFAREFRVNDGEKEKAVIKKFIDKKVVVIDDIGRRNTEFEVDKLCEIMDMRKDHGRNGLIINSNLDLDELSAKFGEKRLSSRIVGMCNIIPVETETDYRVIQQRELKSKNLLPKR